MLDNTNVMLGPYSLVYDTLRFLLDFVCTTWWPFQLAMTTVLSTKSTGLARLYELPPSTWRFPALFDGEARAAQKLTSR